MKLNLTTAFFLLGLGLVSTATSLVGQPSSRDLTSANANATSARNSRAGRMLNLDLLAGDISREEKEAKERGVSGQRQSRTLTDDTLIGISGQPTSGAQTKEAVVDGRSKKVKSGKKKVSIKGFIPIMSVENAHGKEGKHYDNPLEAFTGSNEEEESEEDGGNNDAGPSQEEDQATAQVNREQLMSSYGGQSSIGHASFAPQTASQQWQPSYSSSRDDQSEASRANRKLQLNPAGMLASSKRFVSSLVPNQPILQPATNQLFGPPPSNLPASLNQHQDNCICVPFFQCKSGYLTESQLARNQLQMSQQSPRASPVTDLRQQAPVSSLMSQLSNSRGPSNQQATMGLENQQQIMNDVYEQLKKNIEIENLEQQLQQQQQQQQQGLYQQLDERSKSGANQTEELSARSFLNSLTRRQSGPHFSLMSQKCGIMRTCCKLPPIHPSQLMAGLQPLVPMPLPMQVAVSRPVATSQLISPHRQIPARAEYQVQPTQNLPIGETASAMDYLSSASGPNLIGSGMEPANKGAFMGGRCGLRSAFGIAGRVQNNLAPGTESQAEFGEFPAHAAILKRLSPGDSLFVCSAVLVSSQWLATAAHCVRKMRPEELKVRLGEWDVARDDEFYPFVESNVREIVIHPEFQSSSLVNDMALLRLESAVESNQMPHVAPACLAGRSDLARSAGQRCWVAGWGKDAFGQSGTFQSVLRKVDLPVVGRTECEHALRYQTKLGPHFRLHPSNICAGGERGKDACEGDGGAGLYCSDSDTGLVKVLGLVSWGVGCGQKGVPGVYTSLAALQSWIEVTIAASGEQNLYQLSDRAISGNNLSESYFKSIINERSNANNTQTINSVPAEDISSRDAGKQQSGTSTSTSAPIL